MMMMMMMMMTPVSVRSTSTYCLELKRFRGAGILVVFKQDMDRLCGLVVRVSCYRYRGLGFDSRRYQIF